MTQGCPENPIIPCCVDREVERGIFHHISVNDIYRKLQSFQQNPINLQDLKIVLP